MTVPSYVRTRVATWALIALSLLAWVRAATPQNVGPVTPVDLRQNWSDEDKADFWFTSQGSRLLPYSWFVALKQAHSPAAFSDARHMEGDLGYVMPPSADPTRNPDFLPIGFVRDRAAGPPAMDYVGITCAACHTARLGLPRGKVIVEGSAGNADFTRLIRELVEALHATIDMSQPGRFDDFATAVLPAGHTEQDRATLRAAVATRADELRRQIVQHEPAHRVGPGRADAFGNVNNQVVAYMLGQPSNARPADAPVSYPFLWDTPQHDFVQWNGSGNNRLLGGVGAVFRNVGQALAAFSTLQIAPGDGAPKYASSIDVKAIVRLEALVSQLQSPVWPEAIDADLARRGRAIYGLLCVECHASLNRADPKRRVRARMVDVAEVGTDVRAAANYAERFTDPTGAATGALKGRLKTYPFGGRFGPYGSGADIFSNLVLGAYRGRDLARAGRSNPPDGDANESRGADSIGELPGTVPRTKSAYKARPLNGIWATGPYLHNGSVPTVWELLKPPSMRRQQFYVGRNELDVKEVGVLADEGPFRFDTQLPGNANIGHEYGTTLSNDQKWALIEFIKSL